MKWYNKTKTKCLDISKVSYWEYTGEKDLLVVVDGNERDFEGEEAEQIYNILKNQKEVI